MTNNIAKIRAALLAEESETEKFREALAALAELERAAAEPVATVLGIVVEWTGEQPPEAGTKLYAAPPAPVAAATQFVAGEVDDAMCDRIFESWARLPDKTDDYSELRQFIAAVRSELGPALGMVELKEPTPEECERICFAEMKIQPMQSWPAIRGRAMFDACRAVMWPKEGL